MSTFIGSLTKEEVINLINQMLARNEANDKERFQLKKINIAKSGYAFGRCQHDCGQREDARNLIFQCLVFNNLLLPDMKYIGEIITTLKDYKKKLSKEQKKFVNDALSSPMCMSLVVSFDNNYIKKSAKKVKKIVEDELDSDVGARVKEKILSNPKLFLQLVDYHNQFNLSSDGPLIRFLNGEAIDCTSLAAGKIAKLDTDKIDTDLISEIRRFINDYTLYGVNHRSDCERRQHNIDKVPISAGASSPSSGHDPRPDRAIPMFPWLEPKPHPGPTPSEAKPKISPPASQPTPSPNTAPTPSPRPSEKPEEHDSPPMWNQPPLASNRDNNPQGSGNMGGGRDAGGGSCGGGGHDARGGACEGGGREAGGGACSGSGRDSGGGACDNGGRDFGGGSCGGLGLLALLDNEATEVLPGDNVDSVSNEEQVSTHSSVQRNSTSDFSTSIPFLAPPRPSEIPKPNDDTMTHHVH